jgi:UDP-N-acetylglucosamine 4-epimerase
MKTVLVTGGAGFIGSHICDRLIRTGYQVRCIDNLSNGSIDNIEHLILNKNFQLIIEDINSLTLSHFEGVDLVCHQAAIGSVPRSIVQPELYQHSNVNGFFHVLNLARLSQIKRVVYASSSSVYGSDVTLPKIEHSTGQGLSPYAISKQINEMQAKNFSLIYEIETVGLRYFNVFGPRQKSDGDYAAVIPKFINYCLNGLVPTINGDGSYARDFTYIDNIVLANILALESKLTSTCNVLNIGAGQKTSINELYSAISKKLNFNVSAIYGPERKGDIPYSFADVRLAKEVLGYIPIINVDSGLNNTIDYFKK